MAYYRCLSNDALRVLAGLPGNERAFVQITLKSLDPFEADPQEPTKLRWRDRIGPETDTSYTPSDDLRAFVDALDGRSTNCYFYRSAYIDGAQNLSRLSLSVPHRAPIDQGCSSSTTCVDKNIRWEQKDNS